jgi:hypothetical protein
MSNRTGPPDPPENESAAIRAGAALPHVDRLAGSITDTDKSAARKSCVALTSVAVEQASASASCSRAVAHIPRKFGSEHFETVKVI